LFPNIILGSFDVLAVKSALPRTNPPTSPDVAVTDPENDPVAPDRLP